MPIIDLNGQLWSYFNKFHLHNAADQSIFICQTFCLLSRSVMFDSLQPMDCSLPDSSVHEIFQARNWVGNHSFFQRIFLIQGPNPGLLHCKRILYLLSHREAPIFRTVSWSTSKFTLRKQGETWNGKINKNREDILKPQVCCVIGVPGTWKSGIQFHKLFSFPHN